MYCGDDLPRYLPAPQDWKNASVLNTIETVILYDQFRSSDSILHFSITRCGQGKESNVILDDNSGSYVSIVNLQGTISAFSNADPRCLLADCALHEKRMPKLKTIVVVTTQPIKDATAGDVVIAHTCVDKKGVEHKLKTDEHLSSRIDSMLTRATTIRQMVTVWTNSAVAGVIADYVDGSDLETLYRGIWSQITDDAKPSIARSPDFKFRLQRGVIQSTRKELDVLDVVHQIPDVNVVVIAGAEGESSGTAAVCAGLTAVYLVGGPV